MIYDTFYISKEKINDDRWKSFSLKFPYAQKVENIKSLEDLRKKSFTKFFWIIWDDLDIAENFNLDYEVSKWDENYIHVFKNKNFYDGIALYPKYFDASEKEFNNRYFIVKKEIDIVASTPRPYDIIFISYNESFADDNYEKLKSRFPYAKRIHGIKGIHQAHIEAAKLAETEMFWVVDADAEIVKDFNFTFEQIPFYDLYGRKILTETVHVWFSKNPINDLIYGYGGVKLLPKELTINMNLNKPDMTTSISNNFKVMSSISNITAFNTDEFNTWKSAFRECTKLASKVIDSNYDQETDSRLNIWCKTGEDRPFGKYALAGATAGRDYGYSSIGDNDALMKINDFEWLKEKYETWLKNNEQ